MNNPQVPGLRSTPVFQSLFILLALFSLNLSAQGEWIFLDHFEGDALKVDITNVLRTPAVDTLVPVGNFKAGTRYFVWLIYDLVSFRT